MTHQEFIEEIAKYCIKYAPQFGISIISPIIAQACLESAYGTSYKAQKHNYFGLKYRDNRCPSSNGKFADLGSEQNPDGTYKTGTTLWFEFPNLEMGVKGYFEFINIANYTNLKGITDPHRYLELIKEDHYATSANYVGNVWNTLITNNLQKYDEKLPKNSTVLPTTNNGYSNSPLVCYTKLSPNFSIRTKKITKITIHHMAGNLSVETCGNVFAPTSRKASSNYGIGTDGRIAMYVEEKNRAWTSGSAENDQQAITIEVANNSGEPNWTVSQKAYDSLINLCVDICKRNGIKQLVWTGDKNGTLTCHYMFQATACPGPYLKSKMPEIANLVNARLGNAPAPQPTQQKLYRVRKSWDDAKSQIGAYAILDNAKKNCKPGYKVFDENGNVIYEVKDKSQVQNAIKTLQIALNEYGNYNLAINGIFDDKLLNALNKYNGD